MGKRFAVAGFQNTGKSYPRRWIPDGENVAVLQPSNKFPHLFTGPTNAGELSPDELDKLVDSGVRRPVLDFDLISPEGRFTNLEQAYEKLPTKTLIPTDGIRDAYVLMDVLNTLNAHKPAGYFGPEHIKGNVFTVPMFEALSTALEFVDKHMPWIHTVFLPDFTHYITEVITSSKFLNQNSQGQAFQRYLNLAADAFKNFIRKSDTVRKDLVIVTEYHIEFNEPVGQYEIFVPGGKMVKEKLLPSSYYDVFLFTDTEFSSLDDDAEPIYRYVTRKTRKYPEARSMGIYDELYVPNNIQEALSRFRAYYNMQLNYQLAPVA